MPDQVPDSGTHGRVPDMSGHSAHAALHATVSTFLQHGLMTAQLKATEVRLHRPNGIGDAVRVAMLKSSSATLS